METEPRTVRLSRIQNPVLRGFNPDPSIVRVGADYYLATSTFEWYPGVQIHHSRDLVEWRLVARPLDEERLLEMAGNPDSGGIWAPCLTYAEGRFHLVYTNVRSWDEGPYKIATNYLTTAERVEGPWSDPVTLNGSGFDPSLFHDTDGRKWLLNMLWDHRPGRNPFAGILLQEYCPREKRLVGPVRNIFRGTELGLVEGPHLYRRGGYYYLLTAEGGTEYRHAVTLARSRQIEGPYEVCPRNPILTSWQAEGAVLQKAGHGSLVETPGGEWYLAHLCGRPIDGKHCILGRETALQKVRWTEDGWLELEQGGRTPEVEVAAPGGWDGGVAEEERWTGNFAPGKLDRHFQALRRPIRAEWASLEARMGWLRLYGEEPTVSRFRQSLLARRVQSLAVEVATGLEFDPPTFQQMAGLIAYYDTQNHYYLRISREDEGGRGLNVIVCDAGVTRMGLGKDLELPPEGEIHLGLELARGRIQFRYSVDGENWTPVGPGWPAHILSDDYQKLGFTGAFVGMCCQDLAGGRHPADFRYFRYREKEEGE